ncbi:hypothetical protein XH81_04315 [Bradyrhizobium sp. CCBAU 25360]|uniref:hypothetical protein n=1 Tax=Bradyrhizobium sp. CCBAU 25360 TaxID=858425 RepID=UPI002306960B|nr:hypothetical protein [Bradyrhizobium sp. CCBAU 25360]MDA9414088.1 hypothetical protein [Bradyrhizobium sp. CCBAU 25360]
MQAYVNWTILVNEASAGCAFVAAGLWLYSARVEIWADGQTTARRDNFVLDKDGRPYDLAGTARAQSRWSAYAAIAAAAAAVLQGVATMIS